jgi:hypothetical protein
MGCRSSNIGASEIRRNGLLTVSFRIAGFSVCAADIYVDVEVYLT